MPYQAVESPERDLILSKNGLNTFCPYVQPMRVQGNVGQVQLVRMPCTGQCPLAEIDESAMTWTVNCGGTPQVHKLEAIVKHEQAPAKTSNLIVT